MVNRPPYHRPICYWQVAPLLLAPPAAVGAICLACDLSLTPFLFTLAISWLALLAFMWPRHALRLAAVGAALSSPFLLAASVCGAAR